MGSCARRAEAVECICSCIAVNSFVIKKGRMEVVPSGETWENEWPAWGAGFFCLHPAVGGLQQLRRSMNAQDKGDAAGVD